MLRTGIDMKLDKNRFGMKKNLIMLLCILTVIFLTIIFCILNVILYKKVSSDYINEAKQRFEFAVDATNDTYQNMIDKEQNIINSTLITDEIRKIAGYDQSDINEIIKSYDLLDKFFLGLTEFGSFNSEQIVIYLHGDNFPEGKYINKIGRIQGSDIWEELESSAVYESTWAYSEDYVSVYRHIRNFDADYGYLEIKIPTEKTVGNFRNMRLSEHEALRIIGKDGDVLYSSRAGGNYGFVIESTLADGNRAQFSANRFYIIKNYFIYAISLVVLFFAMLILCFFAYKRIIDVMTKDLYEFVLNIQNSEQMLLNPDLIHVDGDRDILQIKERFKELINRNNQMHSKIERLYKEKARVELNFLQSCINPHLLYNSLSAIKWLMMDSGNEETLGIIDDMTEYYRAVLSGGEEFITVDNEIRLIERYVQIIKTAYSIEIKLNIDVEKELLGCYVIKLLLQPIVENAVVHGVNGIENAQITVSARADGDDIIFKIIDNGYGMDKETADAAGVKNKKGFGLENSRKRIRVYYGRGYGISLVSKKGEGTCVTVQVRRLTQKPKGEV